MSQPPSDGTVPARVTLVTLGVGDVAGATAFYTALGWHRSSGSMDEITFLKLDAGPALALFGWDDLADDAAVSAEGRGFRGVTLAINCASPAEVDAAAAAWIAAGGSLVKQPDSTSWGGYSGYVADPNGHLWEIAHNPYWPFDDRGNVVLPD